MNRKYHLLILLLVASALPIASATAATITFDAFLSGTNVVPPNASPADGDVTATLNDVTDTLSVSGSFIDLLGNATVSSIHCCQPAGSNAVSVLQFTAPFPFGATSLKGRLDTKEREIRKTRGEPVARRVCTRENIDRSRRRTTAATIDH